MGTYRRGGEMVKMVYTLFHLAAPMAYIEPKSLRLIDKIVRPIRTRGLELISCVDNCEKIADIGCGIGTMAIELSKKLGCQSIIVGIDNDEGMIRQAIATAKSQKLEIEPSFAWGDAMNIPLPNSSVNVTWSERMLQHLINPIGAVKEMIRITKPGGLVIIAESDWHSLSITYSDLSRERDFVASLATLIQSPSIARELYGVLGSLGLNNVRIEAFPMVWTDPRDFINTSLSFPDLAGSLHRTTGKDFSSFLESLSFSKNSQSFCSFANLILAHGTIPNERSP